MASITADCDSDILLDEKTEQSDQRICKYILSSEMTCIHKHGSSEIYLGKVGYDNKIIPAIYKYLSNTREGAIMEFLNYSNPNLQIPKIYKHKKDVKSPNLKDFDELLVMEYIEPLSFDILNMSNLDRLTTAKSVAKVVDQLHKLDIYHRDITPDNIILNNKDNKWYIIDFGNATSELSDSYKLYEVPPTPNLAQDNFGILQIANIEFPKKWKSMLINELIEYMDELTTKKQG